MLKLQWVMEMEKKQILDLTKECLQCKHPTCIQGCPVHNNIPLFIQLCKEENYQKAYEVLSKTTTLPSICSVVCPSENQCMGHCIKNKINQAVQIPKIEQYITQNIQLEIPNIPQLKEKVAIVGSGPAGLACAEKLKELGYQIDVFDQYDIPGGILSYGIPDFVLDKKIVINKIQYLKNLGIHFHMNQKLGKEISIKELSSKYDAVFLAIGASIGKKMNIKNEHLKNIVDANEFLEKIYRNQTNEFQNLQDILIIGGGNTAIDAARVASLHLSNKVRIVYRRSKNEMPARKDELLKAEQDGIQFSFLTNPISFVGEKQVEFVECVKMRLESVENDRPRPIVIENSNFYLKADLVIEAISSTIDTSVLKDIQCHFWGGIKVNEKLQTSICNVFAGGDCINGPSLVVTSMKDGITAANNIHQFLNKNNS